MKQENKELLLKDLCARSPYGVKVQYEDKVYDIDYISPTYEEIKLDSPDTNFTIDVLDIEPYLFPLSSMTKEQYDELEKLGLLNNCSHNYQYVNPHIYGKSFMFGTFKTFSLELIDWLNAHHFDYRNLIEKGLAIDATGSNIY